MVFGPTCLWWYPKKIGFRQLARPVGDTGHKALIDFDAKLSVAYEQLVVRVVLKFATNSHMQDDH